ncbi:MAG: RES family NAD+ phosphorylase, partial [Candidatus Berkiella sp.]
MDIWDKVNAKQYIQNINLQAWRVVEDQSRSTTRKLVDTAAEHDILEEIIEKNKPKVVFYQDEQYFKGLHYLLFTPFRYPPLKHGSRFGTRQERSLLYASVNLTAALSEVAFYKLLFLNASEGEISGNTTTYTAFRLNIVSDKYVDLCAFPFETYTDKISSKTDYETAQKLGSAMRENKIACFKYRSARDPLGGDNLGIFSPKCLINNKR